MLLCEAASNFCMNSYLLEEPISNWQCDNKSILVRKYIDTDCDGSPNEEGEGWTFQLFDDLRNLRNTLMTNVNGEVEFTDLQEDKTYTIVEVPKDGWKVIEPPQGEITFTINDDAPQVIDFLNSPTQDCNDICECQSDLFCDYPWLQDTINECNCGGEEIAVYIKSIYVFLFIKPFNNYGQLYFQDGTFWCEDGLNYSCVEKYYLEEPINNWKCNDPDPDCGGIEYKTIKTTNMERYIDQLDIWNNFKEKSNGYVTPSSLEKN